MAGSKPVHRHLSRHSAHRRALLRNLVTSLFEHESISTTWHKAKEAQQIAEKMITYAKKDTEATRTKAMSWLFKPHEIMPKLFGPIAKRYANRPGGYTRVLRIEPIKEDQAPSAILELVDGPKDMRFAMTAYTIANVQRKGQEINDVTAANIRKVTRYREDADRALEEMVGKFKRVGVEDDGVVDGGRVEKKRVYPDLVGSRPGMV